MKLIHAARTEKPQCDPYQVLGIAVIRQAADDYRAIARRLNTIGSSEEKHRLEQEMISRRRFFQGAWYEVLSDSSNGSLILERLDREVYGND